MAVLSYSEILAKKVIIFDDEPFLVLSHHVFRKQQRKPVNVTKLKSLISGRVVENTFHVNETADEADLDKEMITYIFKNKGEYMFHKAGKPGDRFALTEDLLGDQAQYIKEKTDLEALIYDEKIIGVKMPIKVELKVTEASEAVKGNTSGNALKEVTLETGATVFVPQFINQGDIIAINTESGLYAERIEKA
jgi:elongation factor P